MKTYPSVLRNGILVTPDGLLEADLAIAGGKIALIGAALNVRGNLEIDLKGDYLLPGMIDAHVHFNEPGRTQWEGFATGSAAAAAGGVTMVFDMPLNSSPSLLTPALFQEKVEAAAKNSRVKVKLWGGLTPDNLDQLEALHACGVIGFKAFMSDSGIEDFSRVDTDALAKGMDIVARLPGMRVAVHAEDNAMTARLASERAAAGRFDEAAFLESRPIEAELLAITEALQLAEQTGCPLHVVHVSSADGLELIAQAKARGVDVTAETCPHYLALTVEDLFRLGPLAKCAPPLRTVADQSRLWTALCAGKVDTVGSDHSPCPPALKQTDSFASAWGGISGVQHTLPLLSAGLSARGEGIEKAAALTASNPAKLFGLEEGQLVEGAPADLCRMRKHEHCIQRSDLLDRHRHSPYVGKVLPYQVLTTWVEGEAVFNLSGASS